MEINKINQLLEKAVSFYEKTFSESDKGKEILQKYGITSASLFTKHRIGFADGSLLKALPKTGGIIEDLKELGLLTNDGQELFRDCVIFPIRNEDNNLIGLMGFNDGIYTALPKCPYSTWNLSVMRMYPEVYVVDTILDALSLEQVGIDNVVAGKDIKSDGARNYPLPNGVTANDYLINHGEEALKALSEPKDGGTAQIISGKGFSVVYGQRKYSVISFDKTPSKLRATIRVEKGGRSHFDTVNLFSAKERKSLCHDLVLAFNEIPETIQTDIGKLTSECEERAAQPNHNDQPCVSTGLLSPIQKKTGEELGRSQDLFGEILKDYKACGLVGEETNKLVCYLAMTSRKMPKPLNVMIISSSGAGKSALQDATLAFCPPDELIKLTSLSGKALFYLKENSLVNKVIAIEERKGVESAAYAIRTLISSDVLVTQTTVRDTTTGKLTTQENRVDAGKTSVFCTTTNPDIDAETRSRFVVTGITESRELTRAILESQRRNHTLAGLEKHIIQEKVLRKHHAFQKMLKTLQVVNPFAEKLAFTDDSLTARRTQLMYLQLINAVAFIHQMQKKIKTHVTGGKGIQYIEVEERDLKLADEIASTVMKSSMDDLSIPSRDLLGQITAMVERKLKTLKAEDKESQLQKEDVSFTRREIREYTSWRRTRLQTHLKELIDSEYVVLFSGRARTLHYYKLVGTGRNVSDQPKHDDINDLAPTGR